MLATATHDLHVQRWLRAHLKSGDVFYDLGANNGIMTRLALDAVGATGKVVAVDPDPRALAALSEAFSGESRVTLLSGAAWEKIGTLVVSPGKASPHTMVGNQRLTFDPYLASPRATHYVAGFSLDDLVGRGVLPAPTFIKSDTQGGEVSWMRGAKRILAGVRGLVAECDKRMFDLSQTTAHEMMGLACVAGLNPADAGGEDVLFLRGDRTGMFSCNGSSYPYFSHLYNSAGFNERSIEVPIVKRLVDGCAGRVMEIGNVLPHYFKTTHLVVDKYERAEGTAKKDVVGFVPDQPVDLVVSVSTLEHVGRDEADKDQLKCMAAIESVRRMLKPGGKAVMTFPLGYNAVLDANFTSVFDRVTVMRRVSLANDWAQCRVEEAPRTYGTPFPWANAVVIGELRQR
jgi:FkbM family methyltransferase